MNVAIEFVSKLFKVPSAEVVTITEMPMTSDNNAPPPNKIVSDERILNFKKKQTAQELSPLGGFLLPDHLWK